MTHQTINCGKLKDGTIIELQNITDAPFTILNWARHDYVLKVGGSPMTGLCALYLIVVPIVDLMNPGRIHIS